MKKIDFKTPFIPKEDRETVDIHEEIESIKEAKSFIGCFQTKEGFCKLTFTDLGQEEFEMLVVAICQHPGAVKFFKLLAIVVERYLKDPQTAHPFALKCSDYIRFNNPLNIRFYERN